MKASRPVCVCVWMYWAVRVRLLGGDWMRGGVGLYIGEAAAAGESWNEESMMRRRQGNLKSLNFCPSYHSNCACLFCMSICVCVVYLLLRYRMVQGLRKEEKSNLVLLSSLLLSSFCSLCFIPSTLHLYIHIYTYRHTQPTKPAMTTRRPRKKLTFVTVGTTQFDALIKVSKAPHRHIPTPPSHPPLHTHIHTHKRS